MLSVIASAEGAKQSISGLLPLDCFVAALPLLVMTSYKIVVTARRHDYFTREKVGQNSNPAKRREGIPALCYLRSQFLGSFFVGGQLIALLLDNLGGRFPGKVTRQQFFQAFDLRLGIGQLFLKSSTFLRSYT